MQAYYRQEKINVGVFGFTGCAGDQLVMIHDEERLLDYFTHANILSFVMASSNPDHETDLDVALVEGSISTKHEIAELKHIRSRTKILIAIGSCAIHGGIQAQYTNENEWQEHYQNIYGSLEMHVDAIQPAPLRKYVPVDLEISGCPIDKDQIYTAFTRLVHGVPARTINLPVCHTCKLKENECLLNQNELCLGPVTMDGCHAACPSNNISCMGCYGLYKDANLSGFLAMASDLGYSEERVIKRLSCHGGVTFQEELLIVNQDEEEEKNI